jgi:SpoVK/Ycf46/Vps4 family AAA+-type ATPase
VVPLPVPAFASRYAAWADALYEADLALPPEDLELLAGRFRLTTAQINDAVATAAQQLRWQEITFIETADDILLDALLAASRAQTGHELAQLAQKITPVYDWEDIILPEDTVAHLREMVQRIDGRHRVLEVWDFGRKLSRGRGVNALFAGPSGTGKTMAAEVMARELGLDLYKIDLSSVVSKYIGETEKNLDRIFRAAANTNAILFFDEADALFGKRSEVRDSHDRYANIEISYLLQKMEEHDGITILATNLRQNLDEAFVRRLAFTVHFPFPDEDGRWRIWQQVWPDEALLAGDVDLEFLAREFKLSGGNIRNVALASAFLAAAQDSGAAPGSTVTMNHLWQAIRREYQKMGKVLSEAELYGPKNEPVY